MTETLRSGALVRVENTAREISLVWGHARAKRFKGVQFRRIVERFVKQVYKLEWTDFAAVEHFELGEKLIQAMMALTEAWVITQYDSRHTAECDTFRRLLDRLRVALEGIRQGLPPDPAKRLTRAKRDEFTASELRKALQSS